MFVLTLAHSVRLHTGDRRRFITRFYTRTMRTSSRYNDASRSQLNCVLHNFYCFIFFPFLSCSFCFCVRICDVQKFVFMFIYPPAQFIFICDTNLFSSKVVTIFSSCFLSFFCSCPDPFRSSSSFFESVSSAEFCFVCACSQPAICLFHIHSLQTQVTVALRDIEKNSHARDATMKKKTRPISKKSTYAQFGHTVKILLTHSAHSTQRFCFG